MNDKDIILKEIGKIIIPLIQIFGIYIIINGHLSPGGGFSGGTIIGTSFIIIYLIYGEDFAQKVINQRNIILSISFSLIFYLLIKSYSFLSHILNLPMPSLGSPGNILSSGFILPLNILIGILVSNVFYFIFINFIKKDA